MYDKAIKEEFWRQTNDHRQIAINDIWNFLEVFWFNYVLLLDDVMSR